MREEGWVGEREGEVVGGSSCRIGNGEAGEEGGGGRLLGREESKGKG